MVAAMSLHRHALLLTASLALAACAGGPPPPKPWAETATRELHLSLASFELQGRRVTLTRSASSSGPLPVVVYLPGIGQGGEAGQRWAAAWAQAGYAVLGLQPLEDDAAAWRSQLARNGEFRALGELHYGEAMRADRLAALRRLVAALQASPTIAGVQLDWQHTAVAGYEIGAQAALDLGSDGWRPQAVIAISPPPMDAPGALPPALLITSDSDGDALGLVTRPAERRRAFEALRPGAAWLLSLPGASHAALAGTLAPEGWHAQDQHRGGDAMMGGSGNGRRGGQGGQGGQGSHGPAGGAARGPRSGSATEAAQADLHEAMRLSVGFLDAQLRGAAMPAGTALLSR
jgi:dienelactone hydrolase